MRRNIAFLLMIAIYLLFPVESSTGTRKPEDKTIKELLGAADTISIGKTKMALETYLWRDFMPMSPPDGKPLRAVVTLVPVNKKIIPADVDMVKLWVISKQTVWSSGLEMVGELDLTVPQPKIEKMASGGPKWGPGLSVTVLVQLRDPEGNYHLIKADEQMIHRTE